MRDPKAFPELLTPAEMSKADRFAIAAGTPGIALMERAGLAVADEAARLTKSRGRIAVLCGPGGNGGDGFVAARLLASRGYEVEVGLLGRRDALKGDPALAAARYPGPALDVAAVDIASADCVIDALFGAGLARDIEGEAKTIIERVNAFAHAGGRVLAIDVPSGVDGGTGKVRGAAVEASASVTFFRLKPGHLLLPGRTLCGAIRLADIGIPEAALGPIAPQAFVNSPAVWLKALPRPDAGSHKYARGAVLVLSGVRPSHRGGPTRRPGGAPLGRRHRHRREPARRGRRQRGAAHRNHGRAIRERPGVRGAARRQAAPGDRARPRRGRWPDAAQAGRDRADQSRRAAHDRARRRRAVELRRSKRRALRR